MNRQSFASSFHLNAMFIDINGFCVPCGDFVFDANKPCMPSVQNMSSSQYSRKDFKRMLMNIIIIIVVGEQR